MVEGLSTPQVCDFAQVARSTLDYWARTGLVKPSLAPSCGRRFTRWWSITDAVTARAIRVLRDSGCSLQKLREAQRAIRDWGEELDGVVLYWDGADVLALEKWGSVRSLVKRPGQQVLHLVALPLDVWWREAEAEADMVDLAEVRERRRRKRRGDPPMRLAT